MHEVNYRDFTYKWDGTRIVNTFALFGDRLLSDPQTSVLSANGTDTLYPLTDETIRLNYPLTAEPGQQTIRVDIRASTNVSLTANTHNGGDNRSSLSSIRRRFCQ